MQAVQKEAYLITCGRYIERNPVKAGIVLEACEYPYSSAAFYCFGREDGLTAEDPMFCQFGQEQDRKESRSKYREFLKEFDLEEERYFENLEQPVGNAEFLKKLILLNGRHMPRSRGRLSKRFVT